MYIWTATGRGRREMTDREKGHDLLLCFGGGWVVRDEADGWR